MSPRQAESAQMTASGAWIRVGNTPIRAMPEGSPAITMTIKARRRYGTKAGVTMAATLGREQGIVGLTSLTTSRALERAR